MKSPFFDRKVFAWALYDWANSAFATTVMAGFFPVFFKQYWSVGTEAAVSTFRLGLLNGAGSLGAGVQPVPPGPADRRRQPRRRALRTAPRRHGRPRRRAPEAPRPVHAD